jgi:Helix-turn-helix domain
MTYNHLSREERYQISALLKEGLNQTEIAADVTRKKSRPILINSKNSRAIFSTCGKFIVGVVII